MRNDAFLLVYYFFLIGFLVSLLFSVIVAWRSSRAKRKQRLKDRDGKPK